MTELFIIFKNICIYFYFKIHAFYNSYFQTILIFINILLAGYVSSNFGVADACISWYVSNCFYKVSSSAGFKSIVNDAFVKSYF